MVTAQRKAVQWLDKNLNILNSIGDPYEVALVSYALMLAKAATAGEAFSILNRLQKSEGMY